MSLSGLDLTVAKEADGSLRLPGFRLRPAEPVEGADGPPTVLRIRDAAVSLSGYAPDSAAELSVGLSAPGVLEKLTVEGTITPDPKTPGAVLAVRPRRAGARDRAGHPGTPRWRLEGRERAREGGDLLLRPAGIPVAAGRRRSLSTIPLPATGATCYKLPHPLAGPACALH